MHIQNFFLFHYFMPYSSLMDPYSAHSRHLQYNNQKRRPKQGPSLQNLRQMEVKTTNVFDYFRKASNNSFSSSTSTTTKVSKESPARPIASNSRLRRDEKYRRDMYLAFIDNALTQKAKVCFSPSILMIVTNNKFSSRV